MLQNCYFPLLLVTELTPMEMRKTFPDLQVSGWRCESWFNHLSNIMMLEMQQAIQIESPWKLSHPLKVRCCPGGENSRRMRNLFLFLETGSCEASKKMPKQKQNVENMG